MIFLNEKEISQKDFATSVKMSHQTISNIMHGVTKQPKADFLIAIARYYPSLNLRWLLLGEGSMEIDRPAAPTPDEENRRIILQLSESDTAFSAGGAVRCAKGGNCAAEARSSQSARGEVGGCFTTVSQCRAGRLRRLGRGVPSGTTPPSPHPDIL